MLPRIGEPKAAPLQGVELPVGKAGSGADRGSACAKIGGFTWCVRSAVGLCR